MITHKLSLQNLCLFVVFSFLPLKFKCPGLGVAIFTSGVLVLKSVFKLGDFLSDVEVLVDEVEDEILVEGEVVD